MPPRHLLSKSTYIRSMQCQKSLYLYKYEYKKRDPVPPELQVRYEKGHEIGRMAQRLFPGGIDCSPDKPWNYARSVDRTALLALKGQPVIYEAAFMHEQVLAIADIFLCRPAGWIVYEVKSSEAISETYRHDAALQYHVISCRAREAGTELLDFFILHLNRHVDQALEAPPEEVFEEHSVAGWCLEHQKEVVSRIAIAKKTLLDKIMPNIATGEHCTSPYKCDFYGYCHGRDDEGQVMDMGGLKN